MSISKENMDIEDIAKIDFYLKQTNGLDNILAINSLIICQKEINSIIKFKQAVTHINENPVFTNDLSHELQHTWSNLFTKQIKFSIAKLKSIQTKT